MAKLNVFALCGFVLCIGAIAAATSLVGDWLYADENKAAPQLLEREFLSAMPLRGNFSELTRNPGLAEKSQFHFSPTERIELSGYRLSNGIGICLFAQTDANGGTEFPTDSELTFAFNLIKNLIATHRTRSTSFRLDGWVRQELLIPDHEALPKEVQSALDSIEKWQKEVDENRANGAGVDDGLPLDPPE